MQFTGTALSLILSCLQITATAAAFNPSKDACKPADKAYKGSESADFLECSISQAAGPWQRYDCGNRGYVVYDHEANVFRVNTVTPQGRRLTIHAACVFTQNNNVRELGSVDLSFPVPSSATFAWSYQIADKGACQVQTPGIALRVYSWTLSSSEYNPGCTSRPLHPVA